MVRQVRIGSSLHLTIWLWSTIGCCRWIAATKDARSWGACPCHELLLMFSDLLCSNIFVHPSLDRQNSLPIRGCWCRCYTVLCLRPTSFLSEPWFFHCWISIRWRWISRAVWANSRRSCVAWQGWDDRRLAEWRSLECMQVWSGKI